VGQDWEQRYGERVVLVESFVDSQRYWGTSYRAANWQRVGTTCGRGRNGRKRSAAGAPKDIYVLPLERNFRQVLSREPAAGEVAPARVRGGAVRAAQDWAEEEFGGAGLGDERLKRRLLQLARDFAGHPLVRERLRVALQRSFFAYKHRHFAAVPLLFILALGLGALSKCSRSGSN